MVSVNARIGKSVVLNTYSGVGHDVSIGDCCTISAQVDLMGHVKINECCFLGSGSRIVPWKKIGGYSKIGAGVTVIRSLKDNSTIFPIANKVNL